MEAPKYTIISKSKEANTAACRSARRNVRLQAVLCGLNPFPLNLIFLQYIIDEHQKLGTIQLATLYKNGMTQVWEDSIDLLIARGVKLEAGLTADEIAQIELVYNIRFPKSLRQFLMAALPVSKGVNNWRDLEKIDSIKAAIRTPKAGIIALANDVS